MPIKRIKGFLQDFFKIEAASGICLIVATVLALVVVNSPLGATYESILKLKFGPVIGPVDLYLSVDHWIKDALMVLFFLVVGLEIKREVVEGELSTRAQAMLPIFGAVGGMLVPALTFVAINWGDTAVLRGWAIPTATDIAFSLGVLALVGRGVPTSLKVFLTALAIIDDLGAILVIALFYTASIQSAWLGFSALVYGALWALNRAGVRNLMPYLIGGLALWLGVLHSGVHATIAGVLLATTIPIQGHVEDEPAPLHQLEHALHRWVAFGILPIFAFSAAGVRLLDLSWGTVFEPLTVGILLGLFIGKQVGVFLFANLAIKLRVAEMPSGASQLQLYGVALLTGIGFTMSLFIGALAFPDGSRDDQVRLGVLSGSLLSALVGAWLIRRGAPDKTVAIPRSP